MAVKLHVHKNRVEARRKRNLANDATKGVAAIIKERDIRAFAFVGIGADGEAYAIWNTGAILPQWAFGDTIATILKNNISNSGISEDWKPNLTLKGGNG